jgi:hypothetical protein
MLAACASVAQSQPPPRDPSADPGTRQSAQQQRNADTVYAPIVLNQQDSSQSASAGTKTNPQGPQSEADTRIANYTLAIAILTGVLVTVGVIQAAIYGLMLRTTHRVERGYVYAKRVALFNNFAVGEAPMLGIEIINGGKTPVRILRTGGHICYVNPTTRKAEPSDGPINDADLMDTNLYLVPEQNQVLVSGLKDVITQDDFDAVNTGETLLWLYGKLRYRDQFKWKFGRTNFLEFTFEYMPQLEARRRAQISAGANTSKYPCFQIARGGFHDGD